MQPNQTVSTTTSLKERGIMKLHRTLGHPQEQVTKETANATESMQAGGWRPCVGHLKAKAHR